MKNFRLTIFVRKYHCTSMKRNIRCPADSTKEHSKNWIAFNLNDKVLDSNSSIEICALLLMPLNKQICFEKYLKLI